MILLDLAEEMQRSYNKMNLLNIAITKERIAAQPDNLEKLQLDWAGETVRFNHLVQSYAKAFKNDNS